MADFSCLNSLVLAEIPYLYFLFLILYNIIIGHLYILLEEHNLQVTTVHTVQKRSSQFNSSLSLFPTGRCCIGRNESVSLSIFDNLFGTKNCHFRLAYTRINLDRRTNFCGS